MTGYQVTSRARDLEHVSVVPNLSSRFFRWSIGLGLVAAVSAGAGVAVVRYASGQTEKFTSTALVPFDSTATSGATPTDLPPFVNLAVPFTSQAPLMNWAARQHDCEEATLVMVDSYLHGDRSGTLIDPQAADTAINRITPWKPNVDLTDQQLGELAKEHLGWDYRIYPATLANIKEQLAQGRPVIVGVRTHGLGNSNYPGYEGHYEEPGWSVSHYLVITGYDRSGNLILNDPGITRGHGYSITFHQLSFAIDDLDRAYPDLNQGRIVLVLAPDATS
ncbi:MAG TPA: C39 family peptidase [Clostridia bacterium]|nr:C39 family peptidase [Clostridia bacterium]